MLRFVYVSFEMLSKFSWMYESEGKRSRLEIQILESMDKNVLLLLLFFMYIMFSQGCEFCLTVKEN